MRLPRPATPFPSLVVAALALAGCAPSEPDPVPGPTPETVSAGLAPAVRFEGEALPMWTLEERMARYAVPAVSVAVMEGGRIVWARAWGVADTETGTAATPETLFQAASISKPVAALAALSLVEEGRVALDAPVNDVLTNWKVPDNEFTADSAVTLRGLLTHSAGLTVSGFPGYRKDLPFAEGRAVAGNVQILDGEGNTPPVRVFRVPGTGWQYSGGGYTVMEQMVEDLTGLPFEEAVRVRVLEPAGMTRSTYAQPLPEARWAEAARGHRWDGSEIEGEWHDYPEQAAAGLWTTPSELLTLSAHLLAIRDASVADGVVGRETLAAMLAPHHEGDERYRGWGLGPGLERDGEALIFGHGGSNAGFKAQWTVVASTGHGVAVMTNGDRGSALAAEVVRAVAMAYGWPTPARLPRAMARRDVTPEELTALAGAYAPEDRSDFVVEVTAGEGTLAVAVPGQGTTELHPAGDAETFVDPEGGAEYRFVADGEGAPYVVTPGGGRLLRRVN